MVYIYSQTIDIQFTNPSKEKRAYADAIVKKFKLMPLQQRAVPEEDGLSIAK